jgi:sugar lactone lactonase YvrE
MPMAAAVDVALDAGAALGEGPVWDAAAEQLLWVDCVAGEVHRFDPATGSDTAIGTGCRVGAVATRRRGGLVVAAGDGFAFLHEHTGDVEQAAPALPAPDPYVMNDGACDVAGRFWAGTASQDERPTAGLYRLDPDGTVTRMVSEVSMSNGIGWSPDDTRMYYVDSRAQGLDIFEFHNDDGVLGQRRRLVDIDPGVGTPDGLAVDSEGCVWLALWGPGLIHRYTPHGLLERVIVLPVSQTTSCAFGGPGLDVLYITSASTGLTDAQRRRQPHAGALFAFDPGVQGLAAHAYVG